MCGCQYSSFDVLDVPLFKSNSNAGLARYIDFSSIKNVSASDF